MRFLVTKSIILLCLLLSLTNIAIANSYDSIEYNLSLANINASVLRVQVTIKGKFSDKVTFNLPSYWAGTTYIDQIKNIQISPKHKLKVIKKDKDHQATIIIPNVISKIEISYEIHQKLDNPANVHEAIIRNNLVHSPGYGIFATPDDLNGADKIKVNINWVGLSSKWKTLSSYGSKSSIKLHTTASELLHAVYVAGNVRMYKIGDDSQPVLLSLHGNFDIKDQQIVSDLTEIIHSQRTFFNDFDFAYYAISIIEGEDPRSMGGTRLFNSFTAFLPKGMEKVDYYILFAHEHLHNWRNAPQK